MCRTVRSPSSPTSVMVQRSPFLTQSVAASRSRRSLRRVRITSPTLAGCRRPARPRGPRWGVVAAMLTGASVEFGDEVAGGCEHDRVEPAARSVTQAAKASSVMRGQVADVDAVVIEVEPERRPIAFAEVE